MLQQDIRTVERRTLSKQSQRFYRQIKESRKSVKL